MKERVVWECCLTVAAEDNPYMHYRQLGEMGADSLFTWRMFDGNIEKLRCHSPTINTRFRTGRDDANMRLLEGVELYSARSLTFERGRPFGYLRTSFRSVLLDRRRVPRWTLEKRHCKESVLDAAWRT